MVSFIGGGNQSIHRKPPTCHKSDKLYHILLLAMSCIQNHNLIEIGSLWMMNTQWWQTWPGQRTRWPKTGVRNCLWSNNIQCWVGVGRNARMKGNALYLANVPKLVWKNLTISFQYTLYKQRSVDQIANLFLPLLRRFIPAESSRGIKCLMPFPACCQIGN